MSEPYQPLSVRTGKREALPYCEGTPSHLRPALQKIVFEAADEGDLAELMALELRAPSSSRPMSVLERVISHYKASDDNLLDALDYVLSSQMLHSPDLGHAPDLVTDAAATLAWGGSVWKVVIVEGDPDGDPTGAAAGWRSPYRAQLQRRVPESAENVYLSALDSGGGVEQHLRAAWAAAYGRTADPESAWQHAVQAVEAALQPIVEPSNPRAGLGAMRGKILQGPHNFTSRLPMWHNRDAQTPVQAFTQALSRVIYAGGRHGGDQSQVTQDQACAVLAQAITVCEWIRLGIFARAETDQDQQPA